MAPKLVPEAVTDAIVEDYMRYRGETTALAVDIKARRAIARAWNASRKLPGWPQQTLEEPPLKGTTEWPNWRDFRPRCRGKSKAISHP